MKYISGQILGEFHMTNINITNHLPSLPMPLHPKLLFLYVHKILNSQTVLYTEKQFLTSVKKQLRVL